VVTALKVTTNERDYGMVAMTPERAASYLARFPFPRQRRMRKAHVAYLASTMRNGTFAPCTIDLAECEATSETFLVNGYHRLHAVIASGCTVPLYVIRHECPDFEAVVDLYGRLDRGAGRSVSDVLKVHAVSEEFGLPTNWLARISSALLFANNGFNDSTHTATRSGDWVLQVKDADFRLGQLREWREEISAYYTATYATTGATVPLRNVGVASVGLVTLRYQPERAGAFWTAVGENDGLRKGTPERTLLDFLAAEMGARQSIASRSARGTALCWNAAYEGRPFQLVRVMDQYRPITILGTPYKGR
jgi:hypothetical protein